MSLHHKFDIIIPPQTTGENPACLSKFANGDKEAYQWIYENYCRKVFDYAMILTANEKLSEDIVQDVFLKLWLKKEKLKSVENFNGYIMMIVRNLVADGFKKKKVETGLVQEFCQRMDITFLKHAQDVCDSSEDNGTEGIHSAKMKIIEAAVKQLPPRQKQVFTMQRCDGMKMKEIASELNISTFSVQNHIQKGVRTIREYVLTSDQFPHS